MKRKLLKLLILTTIVSICVFIIYVFTKQDKINIVTLGDNSDYYSYIENYLKNNNKLGTYSTYTKTDETIDSLNTRVNTTASIKKDLREAKFVIISVGLNDFYNKRIDINTHNILDIKDSIIDLFPKLDKLFNDIRKYAKYDVVLIGYYNPQPFLFNTNTLELDVLFMYIDSMVKDISKKYDIKYIPLYELFKNNNYISNDIYPNSNGNKAISNEIIKYVKQN